MRANPLPRSESRDGNTTGNHPPLPQSHAVPRGFLRPAATLALVLATGLWTVTLLHPPTALAAAPVSLTLKGQWPGYARGFARDVAVAGTHAYVADGDAGLQVIDVSDPANPVRVGGYDTSASAWGVAVAGNYAYFTDWDAHAEAGEGLVVIDISDPANLVSVGGVDISGRASGVAVAGNHAYVAAGEAGLHVIDVSDPANPVGVGGVDTGGGANAVAVAGAYAYVADYWEGLQVIDVSDPANPVRVGGYDTRWAAFEVALSGNHAYVAEEGARLQVIDVSDPANPVRVGGFDTGGSVTGVAVAGDYAYAASYAGLQAIDVTDPANPVRVGSYPTSGFDSAVAVAGDLIYVADGPWGLLILEQSAATPPPAQWVRIPTDPASTPAGRESAAMVYDEQREVILMHGGRDASRTLSDTWEWDGRAWTLVSTEGPAVWFPGMAYDANRGVTVLYGGRNMSVWIQNVNETWEWDGETWTRMETGSEDAKLVLMTLVYDRERNKVIRHGGGISGDYTNPDPATYEWDGTNWTAFSAGSHVRGGQAAVYEPNQRRTIAFGGGSTLNVFRPPITDNETWAFDGAEWNLVASGEGPAGRVFHAMAYDSYRGVGVLFGGVDGIDLPNPLYFAETWEWDGIQWTQADVAGPTSLRVMHAMAYDPKRRKVVLFGGSPAVHSSYLNQTWEYGLPPLQLTVSARQPDRSLGIRWTGEAPPYQLQSCTDLNAGDWQNESAPTTASSATVQTGGTTKFFRVLSLFGQPQ